MKTTVWILAAALAAAVSIHALADGKPNVVDRHARLLERFGDDGIDANNDGTLTRDEIHAFFMGTGGEGRKGGPGRAAKGAGCDGHRPRHGAGGHDGWSWPVGPWPYDDGDVPHAGRARRRHAAGRSGTGVVPGC